MIRSVLCPPTHNTTNALIVSVSACFRVTDRRNKGYRVSTNTTWDHNKEKEKEQGKKEKGKREKGKKETTGEKNGKKEEKRGKRVKREKKEKGKREKGEKGENR